MRDVQVKNWGGSRLALRSGERVYPLGAPSLTGLMLLQNADRGARVQGSLTVQPEDFDLGCACAVYSVRPVLFGGDTHRAFATEYDFPLQDHPSMRSMHAIINRNTPILVPAPAQLDDEIVCCTDGIGDLYKRIETGWPEPAE